MSHEEILDINMFKFRVDAIKPSELIAPHRIAHTHTKKNNDVDKMIVIIIIMINSIKCGKYMANIYVCSSSGDR